MSKTTDNLGLFKYDPSTDGAQTFNIEKSLNENWDKIDAAVLLALAAAAPYSAQTYALGAYCTRDGKLYRCTTAITTAETWTADHWTETTMGAELVSIYADLAGKAPAGYGLGAIVGKTVSDANMAVLSGWYYHYGDTNAPYHGTTPLGYGMILVSAKHEYVWQTYFANTAGKHVKLQRYSTDNGSTWTEWEYEDPPMSIGVEYRTTERYMGKPVYAKLIDLGLSAAGGTVSANANVSNFESYVFVQAIVGGTATPIFPNTSFTGAWCVYVSNLNSTNISVYTGSSRGGEQCYCLLKYTKTTD